MLNAASMTQHPVNHALGDPVRGTLDLVQHFKFLSLTSPSTHAIFLSSGGNLLILSILLPKLNFAAFFSPSHATSSSLFITHQNRETYLRPSLHNKGSESPGKVFHLY